MTVVDTSIVIRLLAARKDDELLRQRLTGVTHAPALIDAEVASVVRGLSITSQVKKRISAERAQQMLEDYADLRIIRHAMQPLQSRVFELRNNFTSYDAFYVALAEGLAMPLLTDDTKFDGAPSGVHRATIQVYPEDGISEGN